MNALTGSPNRLIQPLRRTAAILLVGSVGLTGCSSADTEPHTSQISNTRTRSELVVDNNCYVGLATAGIMSNTAKPVETFVREHVAALDEATPADLSQCVDETLDAVVHDPANVNIGAGSLTAEVHTVFVPTDITPR